MQIARRVACCLRYGILSARALRNLSVTALSLELESVQILVAAVERGMPSGQERLRMRQNLARYLPTGSSVAGGETFSRALDQIPAPLLQMALPPVMDGIDQMAHAAAVG